MTNNIVLSNTNHWVSAQWIAEIGVGFPSLYFRFTGDMSDPAYTVRYRSDTDIFSFRYCTGLTCTDIGFYTQVMNPLDYFGIDIQGIDSDTVCRLWIFGSTPPPDYSEWGTPDHIFPEIPGVSANIGARVGLAKGVVTATRTITMDNFKAGTF